MPAYDAPCTVTADRGVSVLYRGRWLFSRYAPRKTLQKTLESLSVLPETLILCLSPILPFTVDEIRGKIRKESIAGCFILCVERDSLLYDFYLAQKNTAVSASKTSESDACFCPDAAVLLHTSTEIAVILENAHFTGKYSGAPLPAIGFFKRVLALEASGAVQFDRDFYAQTADFARNSINMFWKNRMTLVNLGRLFSRNVLKNIKKAAVSPPLKPASVFKPVLVAGAGSSLDTLIPFIRANRSTVYLLCVNTALRPLTDRNIRPDAVVLVESQFASEKAFLGTQKSGIPVIADMCSRPRILRITGGKVSFFMSEYGRISLPARIRCALPDIPVFPPLGSVGLAAVETALFLRAKNVPIFICGLDFSYTAGISHCKEAPAQKEAHCVSSRLAPAGNPAAAYRDSTFFIIGKDGKQLACDPALKGYAQLFSARYKNEPDIYDISAFGVNTGLPFLSEDEAVHRIAAFGGQAVRSAVSDTADLTQAEPSIKSASVNNYSVHSAATFYEKEKNRLITLRSALTGTAPLPGNELLKLLEECSYLYLHFPDGHRGAQLSQSFLNRVRSEIDVFLKDIETAKAASL